MSSTFEQSGTTDDTASLADSGGDGTHEGCEWSGCDNDGDPVDMGSQPSHGAMCETSPKASAPAWIASGRRAEPGDHGQGIYLAVGCAAWSEHQ